MEKLRPTVKRDISLFSVLAWQKGYVEDFLDNFGWSYPIIFHYDGVRVNFYHTQSDFAYFKQTITKRLVSDDELFQRYNKEFVRNILELRAIWKRPTTERLLDTFRLIGRIMSFYVFVVSDEVVNRRPEAWNSRHISEGILYTVDEALEDLLRTKLIALKIDPQLAHILTLGEIQSVSRDDRLNIAPITPRQKGYIIFQQKLRTEQSFADFCTEEGFLNPEDKVSDSSVTHITGIAAFSGKAIGRVVILHGRSDLPKVRDGDVVVAVMTNANYTPAIIRASALVTDEGGVTCHAAIVARELKKPCIIGTKIATRVLKDGDRVEVDADKGMIRKI